MCLYSVVVDSEYNFDFMQKSFKIICLLKIYTITNQNNE